MLFNIILNNVVCFFSFSFVNQRPQLPPSWLTTRNRPFWSIRWGNSDESRDSSVWRLDIRRLQSIGKSTTTTTVSTRLVDAGPPHTHTRESERRALVKVYDVFRWHTNWQSIKGFCHRRRRRRRWWDEKKKSMDHLSGSLERDGIKRRWQRRGQNLFSFHSKQKNSESKGEKK